MKRSPVSSHLSPFYLHLYLHLGRLTLELLGPCWQLVHHFFHTYIILSTPQGLAHTMQDDPLNVQMNQINATRLLLCNMKLCSSLPFGNSPGKNLHSYFPSLFSFLQISDFTFLHKYITKWCKFSGTQKMHQIFQARVRIGEILPKCRWVHLLWQSQKSFVK